MSQRDIDTPHGPGRLVTSAASRPTSVLLLGHGAGGGIDAPDLQGLASLLPDRGTTVLRYKQPWRVAGRRIAGRPATLDEGWRAAVAAVIKEFPGLPLFVGGRSAGARVACRCFEHPAIGVVCLSFPLHPPGAPAKTRVHELLDVTGPRLVVQGFNDPFGSPSEVEDALAGAPGVQIVGVQGTHSFEAPKRADLTTEQVVAQIADAVTSFMAAHLSH